MSALICFRIILTACVWVLFSPFLWATDLIRNEASYIGLTQQKIHASLGTPTLSEVFFPNSIHVAIVESYSTGSDKNHLRITYNDEKIATAADIEPAPLVTPRYMGEIENQPSIMEVQLERFLKSNTEEDLRTLNEELFKKKLGNPDRSWREILRAGGRDRHFLNYLYFLSRDGRKAFVVMFNEDNHSTYEYRVQTLAK